MRTIPQIINSISEDSVLFTDNIYAMSLNILPDYFGGLVQQSGSHISNVLDLLFRWLSRTAGW